ncbi:Transcriptional regulator SoxR-family [Acinetobacter baumannii]|nr:Transcriptional regulator SoxR-family [Acinetobacter baumannii]
MEKELDIGEVARLSGIAPSALRHYEKKGLIASIGRNGLRRQYAAGVLEQLKLIALGRLAGFTLDEIASLFDERGRIALDRRLLAARIEELDRTLRPRDTVVAITQASRMPGSSAYSPVISNTISAAMIGAWVVAASRVAMPVSASSSGTATSMPGHRPNS